jgi:tetratricopeptide (TPR) repeat protein
VQALSAASVNAAVRATELSPRDALNWLARGATYRAYVPLVGNAGDFAAAAYGTAIALEPANPANRVELGKTHLAVAESVRDLTGTGDAAVADEALVKMNAALAEAEAAFNAAVALKADYAPAHYQLAVTYERQGRLDDAVGKMESVARYNPYDVGVAFQLGMLYMRRSTDGDWTRARLALERAVELAPTYANARWFLASVYEADGNVSAAVEQIEAILKYDSANELVRQRLERLRSGVASGAMPETIE